MTVVHEYFVPDEQRAFDDYLAAGDRTAIHHLIRYEWACEVLAEAGDVGAVLDVACGSGYGSYQIAQRFSNAKVVGADYDESAIALASDRYSAPNLEFAWGDLQRWDETLGDRQFDCVVCFDTIEHIEHREVMMHSLVEHLSDNGMLLLSTPVRGVAVLNPGWEHHKIEYSRTTLYDFLRRYFEEVLSPEGGDLPQSQVIERLNEGDEIVYLMRMNPVVGRRPIRVQALGEHS